MGGLALGCPGYWGLDFQVGELIAETLGVGVRGGSRDVHVECRVHAVEHERLAHGVVDEDIVAIVGGSDTIVLILVALVLKPQIVRIILGGLL